jgi:tripartite-type tricarboxylate transporter receptor subunit TctC
VFFGMLAAAVPDLANAQAEPYPNKQFRFIVSFPAGSAT